MSFTSLNTPASLFTVWPMKVDTKQGYLTGPTIVDAGQQGSWKLYPHWPASGYDISWNINGFPHPANGDTMLTETISGPGPRWLNAVYTTVDGVSKTVSTLVYTRLRASISGPTTVPTSGDYTWTAVGTTGVEPFGPPTYAWSKQDDGGSNTSLGSGSSATVTVDETTPGFTIELTVSFPGFLNGNASQHVAGPCGGFMCLRAPAGSTKPRASPAGRTKH